jgi:RNA 3'-terminal phosphate cyclase (ATP)
MLILDGSMGEGGGQILRTALALSTVTGIPFRIRNVRAGRPKPGLARQHLTSLRAAARVAAAKVEGAQLHSTDVTFRPRDIRPGAYRFSTGGAGSGTLVLQTVLPSLLVASAPSEVVLEGGTHNPFAPPFDFVERALVPLLVRMGARLQLTLDRPGFYPAGGGRFRARVQPARRLRPLVLPARGAVVARRARALVSALPRHIAERELDTVGRLLRIGPGARSVVEVLDPVGPGNAVLVEVRCQAVTEVFTGFGERGVPAEEVARTAAEQTRQWESADVAVGPHLADQLLLPLAVAGGGSFTTIHPTSHTRTNAEVIRRFLDVGVTLAPLEGGVWQVDVG